MNLEKVKVEVSVTIPNVFRLFWDPSAIQLAIDERGAVGATFGDIQKLAEMRGQEPAKQAH